MPSYKDSFKDEINLLTKEKIMVTKKERKNDPNLTLTLNSKRRNTFLGNQQFINNLLRKNKNIKESEKYPINFELNNQIFYNNDHLCNIEFEILNNNNKHNFEHMSCFYKTCQNNYNYKFGKNQERVNIDSFSNTSNVFLTKLKSMKFENTSLDFLQKDNNPTIYINEDFTENNLAQNNYNISKTKKLKYISNEKIIKKKLTEKNDYNYENFGRPIKDFLVKRTKSYKNDQERLLFSHKKERIKENLDFTNDLNLNENNFNNKYFKNLNFLNKKKLKFRRASFSPTKKPIKDYSENIFNISSNYKLNNKHLNSTIIEKDNFEDFINNSHTNIIDKNFQLKKPHQKYYSNIYLNNYNFRNLVPINNFTKPNILSKKRHSLYAFSTNKLNNGMKYNNLYVNLPNDIGLLNHNDGLNNDSKFLKVLRSQQIPNDLLEQSYNHKTIKTNKSKNINEKLHKQEKEIENLIDNPFKKNYYKRLILNIKKINQNNNMDLNLDFLLRTRDIKRENFDEKSNDTENNYSSFDIEYFGNKEIKDSSINSDNSDSIRNYLPKKEIYLESEKNTFNKTKFLNKSIPKNININNKKTYRNSKKNIFEQEYELENERFSNKTVKEILSPEIHNDNTNRKSLENQLLLSEDKTIKNFVLSKTTVFKEKSNYRRKLILLHNIYDSFSDIEDNPNEKRSKFIFHENSVLKLLWDILVLILVLYSATIDIFMNTFYPNKRNGFNFFFQILSDFLFILDLIFNFFTPYYKDNICVGNLNLIALDYLKKWFVFDLVSSIPINCILLFADNHKEPEYKRNLLLQIENSVNKTSSIFEGKKSILKKNSYDFFPDKSCINDRIFDSFLDNNSQNNNFFSRLLFSTLQISAYDFVNYYLSKDFILQYLRWLRLLRIFKLLKNDKIAQIFQDLVLNKDTKINKISKLVFLFLLLMHISSCLWCHIGHLSPGINEYRSWLSKLNYEHDDYFNIYITSLYFNFVTFFTVGYGDILSYSISERVYNCFILIVGNLLYSFGISSLSSIFTNLTEFKNKQKHRLEILDNIDKKHKLPKGLYSKIKNSINGLNSTGHFSEKFELLDSLPYGIKREVILSMHQKGISKFKFFQCEEREFIVFVLPLLRTNQLNKDDILMSIGTVVEEMHIINKGSLVVCLDKLFQNMNIAQILPNSHFGDILIYLNEKCPYLIKSNSKSCELLTLLKNDYNKIKISFNKIILKILKISCAFLEKLEKKNQVVITLYDQGVPLKDIKKIINKLYYFLVNLNFDNIFYNNTLENEKKNSENLSSNSVNKMNTNESFETNDETEISVEEFILNNDIKLLMKFIQTKMQKEDFESIFFDSHDIEISEEEKKVEKEKNKREKRKPLINKKFEESNKKDDVSIRDYLFKNTGKEISF